MDLDQFRGKSEPDTYQITPNINIDLDHISDLDQFKTILHHVMSVLTFKSMNLSNCHS